MVNVEPSAVESLRRLGNVSVEIKIADLRQLVRDQAAKRTRRWDANASRDALGALPDPCARRRRPPARAQARRVEPPCCGEQTIGRQMTAGTLARWHAAMLTRRRRYFDEYRELDTVKRRAAPLPRTSGGPTGNDAVAENRSEASAVLCRFMLQLADQHPDIARHVASIGTSYEGRTIPALVIGGDTSPPAAIVIR